MRGTRGFLVNSVDCLVSYVHLYGTRGVRSSAVSAFTNFVLKIFYWFFILHVTVSTVHENWVWLCWSWLGLELRPLLVLGGLRGLHGTAQLVLGNTGHSSIFPNHLGGIRPAAEYTARSPIPGSNLGLGPPHSVV